MKEGKKKRRRRHLWIGGFGTRPPKIVWTTDRKTGIDSVSAYGVQQTRTLSEFVGSGASQPHIQSNADLPREMC
jgi:hypothetical protein